MPFSAERLSRLSRVPMRREKSSQAESTGAQVLEVRRRTLGTGSLTGDTENGGERFVTRDLERGPFLRAECTSRTFSVG